MRLQLVEAEAIFGYSLGCGENMSYVLSEAEELLQALKLIEVLQIRLSTIQEATSCAASPPLLNYQSLYNQHRLKIILLLLIMIFCYIPM